MRALAAGIGTGGVSTAISDSTCSLSSRHTTGSKCRQSAQSSTSSHRPNRRRAGPQSYRPSLTIAVLTQFCPAREAASESDYGPRGRENIGIQIVLLLPVQESLKIIFSQTTFFLLVCQNPLLPRSHAFTRVHSGSECLCSLVFIGLPCSPKIILARVQTFGVRMWDFPLPLAGSAKSNVNCIACAISFIEHLIHAFAVARSNSLRSHGVWPLYRIDVLAKSCEDRCGPCLPRSCGSRDACHLAGVPRGFMINVLSPPIRLFLKKDLAS